MISKLISTNFTSECVLTDRYATTWGRDSVCLFLILMLYESSGLTLALLGNASIGSRARLLIKISNANVWVS